MTKFAINSTYVIRYCKKFRAEVKKVTSRADLKILQFELWLEPALLGLITSTCPNHALSKMLHALQAGQICSRPSR